MKLAKTYYNAAYILQDKGIQGIVHKTLLPTYDIFDEYRYFERNRNFSLFDLKGYKVAVTMCEDLWYEQPVMGYTEERKLYTVNPMAELSQLQPDFVINLAASPFHLYSDTGYERISLQRMPRNTRSRYCMSTRPVPIPNLFSTAGPSWSMQKEQSLTGWIYSGRISESMR